MVVAASPGVRCNSSSSLLDSGGLDFKFRRALQKLERGKWLGTIRRKW